MVLKLNKIGYIPHSRDLLHPADRRRLAFWANQKELTLEIEDPLASNILVLSSAANYGYWLKKAKQPIILDLVDAYIGENPKLLRDFLRNIVRTFRGSSSIRWITYTRHLKFACEKSSAIIVASEEQRVALESLNKNIYVIPDSHSELQENKSLAMSPTSTHKLEESKGYIFWEGFGYTLKHFNFIAKELDLFLRKCDWKMYLVTVEEFSRWGGYIGKVNTRKLLKRIFPTAHDRIEIIPWTIENLNEYAARSKFGIIPIDPSDKFAELKSENKLLSMWSLGLPVLFSDIPSYSRVAKISESESAIAARNSWTLKLQFFAENPEELSRLKKSGARYIAERHSEEILLRSWSCAITDVENSNSQNFKAIRPISK
jgi:hypothetical protein